MIESLPVQKVIPATEMRNKLGKLLNQVHRNEQHLVVEKLGIPVAAIISMKDYEQYRRLFAAHQLTAIGRKAGTEAERKGLTEEQLHKELERTRKAVFREAYADLAQQD